MTDLRVTTAGAEAWGSNPSPPLRVTGLTTEVWASNPSPPLRVTATAAEAWVDLASAAGGQMIAIAVVMS